MSIYHCSIKIGSRSKGQSAIAASAYRSGTKMTNNETDTVSDYTRKSGIVHSEIALCANAPAEYADRETLWNAVHKVEKNSNAQLWREIEVALPKEFSREQQIETIREFVALLVSKGMCADWSLHDKGNGNPHAHIMLTMRSIKEDGKWAAKSKEMYVDKDGNLTDDASKRMPELDKNGNQKIRKDGKKMWKRQKVDYNDWNSKERAEEWRELWAVLCNKRLDKSNQIDHRSFEKQGIEQIPTIHEGYVARQIERNGGVSERCEQNREIRKSNSIIVMIANKIKEITEKIKIIKAELEEERKKGVTFNDRFNALFSRANGRSAEIMRGTAKPNRTDGTTEQPSSDTDRRIAELKREQEQQRIADENRRIEEAARKQREEYRRIKEEEQRERERNARKQKNDGAR